MHSLIKIVNIHLMSKFHFGVMFVGIFIVRMSCCNGKMPLLLDVIM